MSLSKSKPSEDDWLRRKDLIWRLNIHDEATLKELCEELRKDGLNVTKSQVEYQLKQWKFKRNITQQTWDSVDRHITKRKREGKESEVVHCGKRVKSSTVEKETARYRGRHIPSYQRYDRPELFGPRSPSPIAADAQVVVYTPQPLSNTELEWPNSLPWLNFPFVELRVLVNMRRIATRQNQLQVQPARPRSIVPNALRLFHDDHLTVSQLEFSKLVTSFDRSMPEVFSGEHLQRVQWIIHGSVEDQLFERLKILIYYLSNNMIDLSPLDLEPSPQWERVIEIIMSCQVLDVEIDTNKLHGTTNAGFMENLAVAAIAHADQRYSGQIRKKSLAILKWLLRSGVSPNIEYYRTGYDCILPLDLAFKYRDLKWFKHLLDAGADPNLSYVTSGCSMFLDHDHGPDDGPMIFDMIRLLLQRGGFREDFDTTLRRAIREGATEIAELMLQYMVPSDLCQTLYLAVERKANKVVEILVQQGADLCAAKKQRRGIVCEQTALSQAAAAGLQQTKFVIGLLKSQKPELDITELITADVFVAAAAAGDVDTLSFLGMSGTVSANATGITPLHAATRHNHLSTCEYLFSFYSSYTPTTPFPSPLWLACLYGHEDIVEFFLSQNTYDINAAMKLTTEMADAVDSTHDFTTYDTEHNLYSHIGDTFTPLEVTSSVLRNNCINRCANIAVKLIRAGARMTGREICLASEGYQTGLLSELLAAGANPNARNERGLSVLQCALTWNQSILSSRLHSVTFVEMLLQSGARPVKGELVSAIRSNRYDLVNLMLAYGGGLTDSDDEGVTFLEQSIISEASYSNKVDSYVNKILDVYPDIYHAGSLCAAIMTRQHAVANQLLANRAKQHKMDAMESTAIGLAAMSGNLGFLQKLLALPQSFKPAYVPIHIYEAGQPHELFWHHSSDRGSPLALAAMGEDVEATFCELLQHGWIPDELTWFVIADRDRQPLAQALLDYNYRIESRFTFKDIRHRTHQSNPLFGPIKRRNQEFVLMLLKAGVDVNGGSVYSLSPLQLAVELGDLQMVDCLLEAGADVNSPRQGYSPIQFAVELGDVEIVDRLLKAGADINAPAASYSGATALQFAAMKGYIGLAKHLLDLGADVNAVGDTEHGSTALETASKHGRLDVLELLLSHGALITGSGRYQYFRSVVRANRQRHQTAANLLRSKGGWSEEDEELMAAIMSHKTCDRKLDNEEPSYLIEDYMSNDGEATWVSSAFERDEELDREV
ncbi:ankyrin repeat-containing domain protein [Xylaria scruposa]|nr:ankyrin repeat-containing domain protein [Xylaria scruposa]